jgi:hypothetical protein
MCDVSARMTGSRGQVKEGGEGRKGRKEGVVLTDNTASTCLSPVVTLVVCIIGRKYFYKFRWKKILNQN